MSDHPAHLRWRHIIVNTKGTWLHGDERGFRDKQHRIHSSGDDKNPPPRTEHAGLRTWAVARSDDPIYIPRDLWPGVAEAFRDRLLKESYELLAIAASANHLHALVRVPDDPKAIRVIVGRCKRDACVHLKRRGMAGSAWSAGGEFRPIRDRAHQINTYRYIATKQKPSYVWTFRAGAYWVSETGTRCVAIAPQPGVAGNGASQPSPPPPTPEAEL